jgi:dGTPase
LQLVTLDELAHLALVRDALALVRSRFTNLRPDLLRKAVVHQLLDQQVTDVLQTTSQLLAGAAESTAEEVRRSPLRVGGSAELAEQKRELERFLYDQVYRHPRLIAVRAQAQERLKAMFDRYVCQPDLLPGWYQQRAADVGLERAVGDYLAGMTDRFCDQQYRSLMDRSP